MYCCNMKKLVIFLFFCGQLTALSAAKLVIEGKFQNKNIFIHNGFGISGVGFCVKEIKVNGNITTDEVNSSSFEIDLKSLQLKYGENVTIEILHSEGCVPKVLNMEDLKPKPTFEVIAMTLSATGELKWTTKNENGALPFIVEQFKWNKWVKVGEIDGQGTVGQHSYVFQVTMHSGANKYRVKQKGFNNFVKLSKDISAESNIQKPNFTISKTLSDIQFSTETAFEVYDAYGVIVKRGFGKQVAIENLGKGEYYLCYDNTLAEFSK